MRFIKFLVLVFLIALFLVFVVQNALVVEVSLFHYKGYMPLFVLILLSAFFGFLFAFLYLMPKEWSLRKVVGEIKEGVERLNKGFFLKAERSFQRNKLMEPLLCWSAYERGDLDKLLGIFSPLSAHMLLRLGQLKEAEERFKRFIKQEPENLLVLKGLRDISFLNGNLKDAVEFQKRILNTCEKWEKENQKKILAELLASLYMSFKEEDTAKESFDLYRTPLTYFARLLSLDKVGKGKDLLRLFERSFEDGFQNQVLTFLLKEEALLTKLIEPIEKRKEQIDPVILTLVYLRLGLLSKVKPLLENLPDYYRSLAISSMSHREEDKMCASALEEILRPWECVCGTRYKEYTPMCEKCLKWNKLELKIN